MGKWKKKLRKFAKKAAPIAMLALGAAALAKRRKAKALNAITDYGDTGPLSGKIGYEGDIPSASVVPRKRVSTNFLASPKWDNWNASYMPLKKGGRVTGIAKRGFGRALKKK